MLLRLLPPGCAACREQKVQGEATEKAPGGAILVLVLFFSFNGKLTPGFNAAVPSDHETGAHEASCFLGTV